MKTIIITLLCFLYCFNLEAQNAVLQGQINGPEQEAVPFSTVALLNADSVIVKGAISEEDGSFVIENISSGSYRIHIQNIEYKDFTSKAFDVGGQEEKTLPTFQLEKTSVQMDEIIVSGKRALIEVHPDKLVFNVANSVNASGNNGLELFGKAPGIIIDPDNNIILQGKTGVQIFINGRPSRLSGTDLAIMLQSMQSDNIKSIEIITNPSAKYEAEGNAGIINIKLINNLNLGYNGTIISGYSRGDYPRANNGITFNYRKGKFGTNFIVTRFDNVFQADFMDVKKQSGYVLDHISLEERKQNGFNISSVIDYAINDKHSISFSGRSILTNGDHELESNTEISAFMGENIEQVLASETLTNFRSDNLNFSLNYLWEMTESSSVSIDASYGNYNNDKHINQPNQYLQVDGTTLIEEVNNSFDPFTEIDLWSGKIDFEKKIKDVNLSAGVKYSYIKSRNNFLANDIINGQVILNEEKSNDFNYFEQVTATYLLGNVKLSEKLNLNAGLRVEHTASEGQLISKQTTGDDNVTRNYFDYFPNISLSYDNKKNSVISLGFGKRITRPNYQDLNPFESKQSELVIWKGNPFLRPKYVSNYQLAYVFKDKLTLTNTFSITRDFFAKIVEIQDTKGTIIIPRNMQRSTTNGLSISYPLEVSNWWDFSAFFNYNRSSFKGEFESTNIDFTTDIFNARIQNNLQLPLGISMDLTAFWSSPFIWRGSVEIDGYTGVNIGIKKEFLNKRLQLRFTSTDIFNTNSDRYYTGNYGGIDFTGVYSNDNHRFGLGATFKFGNQKIKRQKKKRAGLEDELKRISN